MEVSVETPKLFHVYTAGRFGPEKHVGFVWADNNECLKTTTYITFDIVKEPVIPGEEFFKNPHSLNGDAYRKWRNKRRKRWWEV